MADGLTPTYSALDSKAKWTRGLLLATTALAAVAVVSGVLQFELLSRIGAGRATEGEIATNDSRQRIISILQIIVTVGTQIFFMIWFYSAYKNLPTLGGLGLKYSPAWAIGGFFIPVLNLVRPFQVMKEVSRFSDPNPAQAPEWADPGHYNKTPPLVGWWWALFVASACLGIITRRTAQASSSLEQLQGLTMATVVHSCIEVPRAMVTAKLVGVITSWQAQKHGASGEATACS